MPPAECGRYARSAGSRRTLAGLGGGPGRGVLGGGSWAGSAEGGRLGSDALGLEVPGRGPRVAGQGHRGAELVVCLLAATTTLWLLSALALRSCGRPCSRLLLCLRLCCCTTLHCATEHSHRLATRRAQGPAARNLRHYHSPSPHLQRSGKLMIPSSQVDLRWGSSLPIHHTRAGSWAPPQTASQRRRCRLALVPRLCSLLLGAPPLRWLRRQPEQVHKV